MALLSGAGAAYGWGRGRLGRRRPARSPVLFAGGLTTLGVALVSPLDGLAGTTLTAHMVQHLLLTAVAAPLLVAGAPMPALLAGIPPSWRAVLGAVHRRARRAGAGRPGWIAAGAATQTGALWLWHAPLLHDGALRHEALHVAEHVSLLAAALFFWWAVAGLGRRSAYGTGVLALFAGMLPITALGAAMATAGAPWYASYGLGAGALDDQRLAGVVMWGYGGLAGVVAATTLFAAWLRSFERSSPGWPLGWPARDDPSVPVPVPGTGERR